MAVLCVNETPDEANASGHSRMHPSPSSGSIAQRIEAFRGVSERPAFTTIGRSLAGAGVPNAERIVDALRCWLAWEATGAEMDEVSAARLVGATARFPAALGFRDVSEVCLSIAGDAVRTMRAAAASPSSPLGVQCAAALASANDTVEASFLRAAALLLAHGLLDVPPCADPANCHCAECEATHDHPSEVVVVVQPGTDPVAASFTSTLTRMGGAARADCPTGTCPLPIRG